MVMRISAEKIVTVYIYALCKVEKKIMFIMIIFVLPNYMLYNQNLYSSDVSVVS